MNPIAASQVAPIDQPVPASLEMQLDGLRLLLLKIAESLCAADAAEVEKNSAELLSFVIAARSSGAAALQEPASAGASPKPSLSATHDGDTARVLAMADLEQKRRLLLLPVFEARALYLAALRRWRRSLRLRRSLLALHTGEADYRAAELSRWC